MKLLKLKLRRRFFGLLASKTPLKVDLSLIMTYKKVVEVDFSAFHIFLTHPTGDIYKK